MSKYSDRKYDAKSLLRAMSIFNEKCPHPGGVAGGGSRATHYAHRLWMDDEGIVVEMEIVDAAIDISKYRTMPVIKSVIKDGIEFVQSIEGIHLRRIDTQDPTA